MDDLKRYEYYGYFIIVGFCILGLFYLLLDYTNVFFWRWFLPHNTSLWELGRLMFTAILLQSIIQYFIYGKMYDNYFFANASTLFIAPLIFIGGSYLIDLMFGDVFPVIHIIMFALGIAVGQVISYQFLEHDYYFRLMNEYAVFGVIAMLLVLFSQLYETKQFRSPIFKPRTIYQQKIRPNR